MTRGVLNFVPVTSLLLSLGGIVASHHLWPATRFVPYPLNLLGLALAAAGLGLVVSSLRTLHAHRTTLHPGGTPSALVVEGPYRFSRNPVYLGDLCVLVGVAVFLSSVGAFLFPVAFFAVVNGIVIPFEERILREQIGGAYDAYKQAVRRWI